MLCHAGDGAAHATHAGLGFTQRLRLSVIYPGDLVPFTASSCRPITNKSPLNLSGSPPLNVICGQASCRSGIWSAETQCRNLLYTESSSQVRLPLYNCQGDRVFKQLGPSARTSLFRITAISSLQGSDPRASIDRVHANCTRMYRGWQRPQRHCQHSKHSQALHSTLFYILLPGCSLIQPAKFTQGIWLVPT